MRDLSLLILACAWLLGTHAAMSPALAQTGRVDYKALESAGLYIDPKHNSLGRDLWYNTDRDTINALLPALPAPGRSKALQDLTFGLLLSKANATLIEGGINKEDGEDLYTLRMEKLLAIGAYQSALDLYALMNQEPYHPRLAKAGILAMLYNGQRSLACLEFNSVQERGFTGPFWTNIQTYCDTIFHTSSKKAENDTESEEDNDVDSPANAQEETSQILPKILGDKNYKYSYSPASYKKLSQFDQALLIAENALQVGSLPYSRLKSYPPSHTSAFLSLDLTPIRRFFTLAYCVDYGLTPPEKQADYYLDIFNSKFRNGAPAPEKGWLRIPYYYGLAAAEKDPIQKWTYILAALTLKDSYPDSVFNAFAPLTHDLQIDTLQLSDIFTVIKTNITAGHTLPRRWVKHLNAIPDLNQIRPVLALLAYYETPSYERTQTQKDQIESLLIKMPQKKRKILNEILRHKRPSKDDTKNTPRTYEKEIRLTLPPNYVMPNVSVWDRLSDSGQNGRVGEAVLLSTLMLDEAKTENFYSEFVDTVLELLDNLGLTKISKLVAYDMILNT